MGYSRLSGRVPQAVPLGGFISRVPQTEVVGAPVHAAGAVRNGLLSFLHLHFVRTRSGATPLAMLLYPGMCLGAAAGSVKHVASALVPGLGVSVVCALWSGSAAPIQAWKRSDYSYAYTFKADNHVDGAHQDRVTSGRALAVPSERDVAFQITRVPSVTVDGFI